MRIVFMGSDELACPALAMLLAREQDEVVGVVTQPGRPKGRHRQVTPCIAQGFAEERGQTVLTPEKVGDPAFVEQLLGLAPDLVAVAAYGQYIPERVLNLAGEGAVNIHPSLLPKYRGASPIQWAIANGETETGVSILYMSKELDAGDLIVQESMAIDPDDTTVSLKPRLAELGARLLGEAMDRISAGSVTRTPQVDAEATYVHKLKKEEGRIDWAMPAQAIRNRIRGFLPWPCCFCEVPVGSGHTVRILRAETVDGEDGEPGQVVALDKEGPRVAAGIGSLRLLEVQPEGKKPMSGRAYLNGRALEVGVRLG